MIALWPGSTHLPIHERPRLKHAGQAQFSSGDRNYILPDHWSLLVFHYAMAAWFDERPAAIEAGHLVLIPPGGRKRYRQRGRNLRHLVFHFALPPGRPQDPLLPEWVDLQTSYPTVSDRLLTAVGWAATDPARTEIRLWDLLHELSDLSALSAPTAAHPHLVLRAQRLMEQRLAEYTGVARIAKELGCSLSHLCATFTKHTGISPGRWMRQRRMTQAEHLLRHSDLPIRTIAAEVGIPDLQHFNKTVRRAFGRAPRALRGK
jgi:AraC family transcriptional regulator